MKSLSNIGALLVTSCSLCASGLFAHGAELTQEELIAAMDKEAFRFIHGEDWRSWIQQYRNRGVTDEMFVKAYSEIALRTMNAQEGSEEAEKCRKSINSIWSMTPDVSQLSNIVCVAETAVSDKVQREAVWAYYYCAKGSDAFLDFADRILSSTNRLHGTESKVLSCLYTDAMDRKDRSGPWHCRTAQIMRRYLSNGGQGLLDADQILMWTDPTYAASALRRVVRSRILSPEYRALIETERGRFGVEAIKRYRREEEDTK